VRQEGGGAAEVKLKLGLSFSEKDRDSAVVSDPHLLKAA
jgi:hypothetical protein